MNALRLTRLTRSTLTGIILIIFITLPLSLTGTEDSDNSQFISLDNGLKTVMVRRTNIPLVNMVFAVNVGSKNETPETSGLMHLMEHLILLGETRFHGSDEMNLEMRRHGAHFNAHTSHDMMAFEFSLPAQYWEEGLNMLNEKLFQLKFSREKLEKEKAIIYEEMAQNRDNPFKRGTHLALQQLFKDHPYQQPIAGDPEVIKNASVETLETFYKRFFKPSNCALAVVGDIDLEAVEAKIKLIFGKLEKEEEPGPATEFKPAPKLKKNIKVTEEMDIQQSQLIIGFHAPPSNSPDQLPVQVFSQVVGKGLNPLLGSVMARRGRRLVYGFSTHYVPLQYGGAFLILLNVEPKNMKTVRTAVLKFFNRTAWNFKYSVSDYPVKDQFRLTDWLETAKNRIKFSGREFLELGMNAAVNYAMYVLFHYKKQEKEETVVSYLERLEKVTSANLRNVASRYFSGKKYITVTLMPEKKKKKLSERKVKKKR
ncbi:MAG: insulinase family protein [bacterium]|nr:insulinase family protein [bacterium]